MWGISRSTAAGEHGHSKSGKTHHTDTNNMALAKLQHPTNDPFYDMIGRFCRPLLENPALRKRLDSEEENEAFQVPDEKDEIEEQNK